MSRTAVWVVLLLAALLCLVVSSISIPPPDRQKVSVVSPPSGRLVPTPAGSPVRSPSPGRTMPAPTNTWGVVSPSVTPTPLPVPPTAQVPLKIPGQPRWRFGAVDRLSDLTSFDVASLQAGWFLTGAGGGPAPPGTDLVYLVPVVGDTFSPGREQLSAFVASRPGSVWQVGNEPDVSWQSNCTPEQYARVYRQLYALVKQADPSALVAAGAISQPTPLRRLYLDLVVAEYRRLYDERMPVDVWAVHNALVREEQDEWGVGIPPGLPDQAGQLFEIQDNDRLDIFQQQIVDFRTWMRDRGYHDRPLVVTEFSILMPFYYDFDTSRVAAFMTGAFDFMLSAMDQEIGYPADGYRLVQRWAWYSVSATDYPTGNLFDPDSREMTPLGRVFANYVGSQ